MEMRQACFREYDKLAVFERLVGAVLTLQMLAMKSKRPES